MADIRDTSDNLDPKLDRKLSEQFNNASTESLNMSFIIKKTRRISSGLYLSTQHIGQSEPIRGALRDCATRLVGTIPWLPGEDITLLESTVLETLSYLEIAAVIGLMGPQNVGLLRRELYLLLELLRQFRLRYDVETTRAVEDLYREYMLQEKPQSVAKIPREQRVKPIDISTQSSLVHRGKYAERIVAAMAPNKRFSIGEIHALFPEISAKTLQRELGYLVAKGDLTKEGERRWSAYIRKVS